MKKKLIFIILLMFLSISIAHAEYYYYDFNSSDLENFTCEIEDRCIPIGSYVIGSHLYTVQGNNFYPSVNDADVLLNMRSVGDINYYDVFYKEDELQWVGVYGTGINGYTYMETPIGDGVESTCITHINGELVAADAECPSTGGGGSGSTNTSTAFFHSEGTLYQVFFEPGTAVSQAKPKDKEGYEFRCWVDFEGDGAPENRNCIDFEAPGYTTPDGFHFESSYNHIEYTIKYDINGGTGSAPADTTCDYDFMNMAEGLENNPCAFASGQGLTKTGYYFVGWSLNKDFNSTSEQYFQAGTNLKPVLKDKPEITLYAVWQPKTYNLVVDKNNGEEVLRIPYTYNSQGAKVNLILPSKDYYNFTGWELPENVTANATNDEITIPVTGPVNIKAKYVEKEVKFYKGSVSDANLLKTCKMVTDKNGCDLGTPTGIPTHRQFDGWKIKDTTVVLPTTIKPQVFDEGNIIVDAVVSDIEHKATYVLPDGAVGGDYVQKYTLYNVTKLDLGLATKPVKTGYHWIRWTVRDTDGNGTYNVDNDGKITVTRSMGDVTVTAVMNANKIYIKYNDGSSDIGEPQECTYDQTCKVQNRTIEPDPNKTFVGWEYNGVVYQTDDSIKNITADGTITLVAKYNFEHDVYYPIEYEMGDAGEAGTLTGNVVSQLFSQNTNNVKLPKADARGYKFNGWEKKTGEKTYVAINPTDGEYYVNRDDAITVGNDKKIIVRAKWIDATYHITLKDGNTVVGDVIDCDYGATCTLGSHPGLTNDNYRLVGWSLSSDGEAVYSDNADITDIYDKDSLNITLYAVKEPIDYKIFYYANGGTLVGQSPQVHNVLTDGSSFELLSASKNLSNFNGWTTVDGTSVDKDDVLELREDVVLIADFDTEYDVVLKVDGATLDTIQCTYGVACPIEYSAPTKPGYKFVGFFNGEEELSNTITNSNVEISEIVYNAVFHKRYAVDYYIEDLHSADIECYVDEPCDLSVIPTNPQKEGYVFTGWSSSVPGINYANPLTVTVNLNKVSFTADFVKNTYDVIFYEEDQETVIDTKHCTYGVACDITGVTAPAKTHFEFAGWIAKTQGVPYANSITVQRESGIDPVEFVAAYNRVEYDVVFYKEDGTSEIDTLTCKYGIDCDLSSVSAPAKEGWVFDHWNSNIGYIQYRNPLMVQNDQIEQVKFTAVYKKPYTVRFTVDENTTPEEITCYIGQACDLTVDDPVVTGRTFKEWVNRGIYTPEYEDSITITDEEVTGIEYMARFDDQYIVKHVSNINGNNDLIEYNDMLCEHGAECTVLVGTYNNSPEARFIGFFDSFAANATATPSTLSATDVADDATEYIIYDVWTNNYKAIVKFYRYGNTDPVAGYNQEFTCIYGHDCALQLRYPSNNVAWINNVHYELDVQGIEYSNPLNISAQDLDQDSITISIIRNS